MEGLAGSIFRRTPNSAWPSARPPSRSAKLSLVASGKPTVVETERIGSPQSCSLMWEKTPTWFVAKPPRRSSSQSRAAYVATACSSSTRSVTRCENERVIAQLLRWVGISASSRQASGSNSQVTRSPPS